MDNTETHAGIDEVTGLPVVHNDGGFDDDESPSETSKDDDFLDGDFSLEQSPAPKAVKRAPDNEPCILLNAKIDRMFDIARHFGIPNFRPLH